MLVDLKCPNCDELFEDKIIFDGEDIPICSKCNTLLEIIPVFNATFRLKYDNKVDKVSWGAEGYARSQYYDQYDKQKKGNIYPVS